MSTIEGSDATGGGRDDVIGIGDALDDEIELRVTEAFDTFYRRELPGLVALARSLSGSIWADDIAQDAMLAAYRRWDMVGSMDLPAAWVRRACANRAISTLRRRAVEIRGLGKLVLQRERPTPLGDDLEEFWGQVRKLPRRQAQAIALHYVYDLGVAEIATTLGCAEGTVKSNLFRGRAALAATLNQPLEGDS